LYWRAKLTRQRRLLSNRRVGVRTDLSGPGLATLTDRTVRWSSKFA